MNKTIIIIPSRMSATRLKGKPLLKINNTPLICHVVKKAEQANIGDVIVATEDKEILDAVEANGTVQLCCHQENKCVVVSVRDDGVGIPEKTQQRIFEPFFSTKEDKCLPKDYCHRHHLFWILF